MSNIRLIIALTVVCIVSALCLSMVNGMTRGLIEEQDRQARLRAVRTVLPAFDNNPTSDTQILKVETDSQGNFEQILLYIGKKDGGPSGVAFEVVGEGYGGMISMMLGIDVNGYISGVHVLKHAETPGLGAKIEEITFRGAFRGKSLASSKLVRKHLAVKKDGGDIDAITGATISSRGVTAAVSRGLKLFKVHKQAIFPTKGTP